MSLRKIEFRGIDKTGTWRYGDFVCNAMHGCSILVVTEIPPSWSDPAGDMRFDYHTVEPNSVGQYTGLETKGGDRIFEGDICTKMISPDENNLAPKELYRGEIVYHYGGFCLKVDGYYYPLSRQHGVISLIGNAYENPDLIPHPSRG